MPVLTAQQVGAYWILAGGPRDQTAEAISQAYVESGFKTDAVSSVGARGLWQIYPGGSFDPLQNARQAVAKWRSGGNTFVTAWTNFQGPGTEAKRLAYLPRAKVAANRIVRMNSGQLQSLAGGSTVNAMFNPLDILPNPTNPLGPLDELLGVPGSPWDLLGLGDSATPNLREDGIPNPLDALKEISNTFINIANLLKGFIGFLLEWGQKLTEIDTWKDMGKILIGFMLLWIGAKRIFTISTGGS
jgi:transglycosylase-like protein with SLT domain